VQASIATDPSQIGAVASKSVPALVKEQEKDKELAGDLSTRTAPPTHAFNRRFSIVAHKRMAPFLQFSFVL
jgi:hypothetical protein